MTDTASIQSIARLLPAIVALGLSVSAFAEQRLLLVRITDTEFTEYSACESENCVPHDLWTIHDAEVKKVIAGNFNSDTVRFVRLQHAKYKEHIREHLFVLLRENKGSDFEELFGTNLVAEDTAFPRSLVCFHAHLRDAFPAVELFEHSTGTLDSEKTCFDQDLLENGLDDDEVD